MRPLLLLDVDGVLMPLGSSVPRGYERHVAESSNLVASSQHGVWLHELSEGFEIVWATTWEDSANDTFGILFELPRFDFVELNQPATPRDTQAQRREGFRRQPPSSLDR